MKQTKTTIDIDPEITAISTLYSVLRNLDPSTQDRVMSYVREKLGLKPARYAQNAHKGEDDSSGVAAFPTPESTMQDDAAVSAGSDDTWNSVSAVAKKWIQRNDLDQKFLTGIFSVGGEEIDLIAKAIPGKSKRQRMREVILLKCVAAYLGSGVPRVTHEALKEACSHYSAFDPPHFANYLKDFSAEVSGGKEAGYTLNARGLAGGADLLKEMKAKVK